MNVLSCFDGISCGQLALNRAFIGYDTYYASEINQDSIKVTQYNYPNTIQLGSITEINFNNYKGITLLLGGSPCQDISNLNKDKESGLNGVKSSLFFTWLEAKRIINPKYWLLENVDGNKEAVKTISKLLRTRPLRLNSNLVSGQNRHRLYWTNIPVTDIPKNRRIRLQDILESNVDAKYYQNQSWLTWWLVNKGFQLSKKYSTLNANKAACLTKRMYASWNGNFIQDEKGIRRLTPIECERLQTIPDDYTASIIDKKRYEVLGDCWTIDIIAHILSFINPHQ